VLVGSIAIGVVGINALKTITAINNIRVTVSVRGFTATRNLPLIVFYVSGAVKLRCPQKKLTSGFVMLNKTIA
jgi:hypothetical protein